VSVQLYGTHTSRSERETEDIGAALGEYILSGTRRTYFIAMYGGLGAGKTAFTRGLARALTPGCHVSSPTFALVNEYAGSAAEICHMDLYRVSGENDLFSAGFYDYLDRLEAADRENSGKILVIAVEWSENLTPEAEKAATEAAKRLNVTISGEGGVRRVEVRGYDWGAQQNGSSPEA